MAMILVGPVGPRAPKEEFMRALGLNPADSRHEGYYRAMRDEAIAVYNQMNADRSNLKDEQQRDMNVVPPFFWHHIREDRREAAVRQTWQNARPGTAQRLFFDRGQTNGDHKPNWVTLWLLYSVFRSRDIRNNRNRRTGESKAPYQSSPAPTSLTNALEQQQTSDRRMFDPARDSYVIR